VAVAARLRVQRETHRASQTLAYGLTDSPVGQCAWIAEKSWAWTDHDGDPRRALSPDQMLGNVSVYWHTATGASAARIYWEDGFARPSNRRSRHRTEPPVVPVGVSVFPREIVRPSRRWCERCYPISVLRAARSRPRTAVNPVRHDAATTSGQA
jgi:hypothetical protein